MKVDVLLGLQWGDEGKGKVVDVLTPKYNVIARFQGGPNAGHSLEFNNTRHVLHTIPSGIFRENAINIIGNGVVIDPVIFKKEIDALMALGVDVKKNLFLSKRANLILPSHRILDAASEAFRGKSKIGSTLKGIGPTYMDKTGRNGLRIGDIISSNFKEKYDALVEKHRQIIQLYVYEYDLAPYEKEWFEAINLIKEFNLVDSEQLINEYILSGKNILAEGAQGTLLDIDFGTYPFVTSSNTICAGACTGLGIAPNKIGEVFGIFKAYCTRVGSGPFPTELFDETGSALQKYGNEFGSTTGRARRCGWLDLPALKYAIMLNGVTQLIMTKPDVMDNFNTIKVATAYNINGKETQILPFEVNDEIVPVYIEFKGWKTSLTSFNAPEQLPSAFVEYVKFIEKEVQVPVTIISVGPGRDQIIFR
ncbi:MAG: adenylosuccinate synthase [Bacteroidetes bacterium RIFOXYA12_FULL_35_11]|nr:MAG: adenylosuccinate synthase [Bacteroidetes bacterium GWF2_35_48]OFY77165.1 MAG: adenylosuccinate synthase [Bacteroidetes bacterium RIFOXYA12_FULL_35_11]HBX50109.1 adenylosuccinate synthase [Bacteroidales bacterium]